ncbi:hypothetical protein THASP1DRAFT_22658 [Thamnocephalis sphaerospora]|uniref:Extracellular membrane protein CFEM domain-containing protein n=1 Tax=Thamnocephalis sphaerospora TaxID=78915 RepID=A0A4P9XTJ9_9FUNG|nr:hypothetical protein THASP1DRAFT_22658 [Thamnocephalis sphaerospora]|eukprot:RKP09514.1 hypothetical protein THASP1DRAFT_22658 [Thamnocephalis sphaerospora]
MMHFSTTTLCALAVTIAAVVLPTLVDAMPSDLSVPADCPHKSWKAVCQRYCLCKGATIQANRCYAKDKCQLMCKCSDNSFTAIVRDAFAEAEGLAPLKCRIASDDGAPTSKGSSINTPNCDGDCQAKCDNYLTELVRNPSVQIIPDNGNDPNVVVYAKKSGSDDDNMASAPNNGVENAATYSGGTFNGVPQQTNTQPDNGTSTQVDAQPDDSTPMQTNAQPDSDTIDYADNTPDSNAAEQTSYNPDADKAECASKQYGGGATQ